MGGTPFLQEPDTQPPQTRVAGRSGGVFQHCRIVVKQDGTVIAEHRRNFGRGETVYDPWHYVPVLARKPGALRNGAPFRDWVLPAAMEKVRKRLKTVDDGDRQMVTILGCVPGDGITAVEAACQEALD